MDDNARNTTAKPFVVPEIITLPDEIDVTNAQSVGDELQAAFGSGAAVVIADMSGTTYLDSSGVRYLLLAHEHAAQAGAQLRLVTESAAVLRILQITGVDRLLKIYPNLQAALTNPGPAGAQEAPSGGQERPIPASHPLAVKIIVPVSRGQHRYAAGTYSQPPGQVSALAVGGELNLQRWVGAAAAGWTYGQVAHMNVRP